MKINDHMIDRLSNNDKWKMWLNNNIPEVYSIINDDRRSIISACTALIMRNIDFSDFVETEKLNKHGVFKIYNPGILTFPSKIILIDDDKLRLVRRTRNFVKNKYGVDYLIIEDRAYIEYFNLTHRNIVKQINPKMREINIYKRANHL